MGKHRSIKVLTKGFDYSVSSLVRRVRLRLSI
jgi:hypothetical protein